jgi:apolipoprotein N-acyltransferase
VAVLGYLLGPLLAAASAVLIALALPPRDVSYLPWVCLVPLFEALRRARSAGASVLTCVVFVLVFGSLFASWLPGTVTAFFAESSARAWLWALGVYAVFGIPCYGPFVLLSRPLLGRAASPWVLLLGIPALWVAAELLRARLFGGLPWALLGHALYRHAAWVQTADLAGVSGVSFVLATANAGLFVAARGLATADRRASAPGAAAALVVLLAWGYGQWRLQDSAPGYLGARSVSEPRSVSVGILQPNQPPVYRWTRMAADRALAAYARLTRQYFRPGEVALVVWPENALSFYVDRDSQLQAQLAQLASSIGSGLIVGAPAAESDDATATAFNAAYLIVPSTGLRGAYRKRRLVPFAEYRPAVPGIALGNEADRTFIAGSDPTVFELGGVRWGPTICLDFMFADVVRSTVRAGAAVLVNLSNDSWLTAGGPGAAAQQHAQAVFRAVENRRDVVRATTTGISAVITAAGHVEALLDEGHAGALRARVVPRHDLTVYTRYGDVFGFACGILGVSLGLGCARGRSGSTSGG